MDVFAVADIITGMVADITTILDTARKNGDNILFEGAQGTMLDIDPRNLSVCNQFEHHSRRRSNWFLVSVLVTLIIVLGIIKAYCTRVGGGPFTTELFDETGAEIARKGNEFGAVTGRPRRCGWFDAVAIRRAIQLNSILASV